MFSIHSLNELNPEQKSAAMTIDGPVLILAGAGSGKTRTITYRIAHMIENLRIPSTNILALSFTNKAAREMKERVIGLIGKKSEGATLSTFHSLGVQILKREITRLGYRQGFGIYDTADQISIIKQGLATFKGGRAYDAKKIQAKISFLKNNGISSEQFRNSKFFNNEDEYDDVTDYMYKFYQEKLKFLGAIDFDDILFLNVELFRKFPDVASYYSSRFRYIMIDEYQDTNQLQFNLVRSLTSTHKNICVVGDDDQSIYAFRAADITNILNFEKEYPNTKRIKLEENYRSTTTILNLANEVIKGNKNRMDKTLWSKNSSTIIPELWATGDNTHEAEIVVEDIIKKNNLEETAILYRGNNQLREFEDQLRMNNTPYRVIGGQKFYDKKEIKDLMSYLFTIMNTYSEVHLRRVLNVPARGIGTATLEKFIEKADQNKISIFSAMEKFSEIADKRQEAIKSFTSLVRKYQNEFKFKPLDIVIENLIEEIKFKEYIDKCYEKNVKQAEVKKNDLNFFIASAQGFMRYMSKSNQKCSLEDFCDMLLLQDSQDSKDTKDSDEVNNDGKNENQNEKKEEVTLMTLHSSKGLEFNYVYLVGVEEDFLPHKRSIEDEYDEDVCGGGSIEEERRLCYVGITRAKKKLIMTYAKERTLYGKKVPRKKSRFLYDAEKKKLFKEVDITKFEHLASEDKESYKKDFFSGLLKKL